MAALTCGDRVREIRIRLGMSQSALAKKADVSQAAISKIENNATDSSNIEIEGRICWKGGSM